MAEHAFELMVRADNNTLKYACACGWVSEAQPTFTSAETALAEHVAQTTRAARPLRA